MKKWHPIVFFAFVLLAVLACNIPTEYSSTPSSQDDLITPDYEEVTVVGTNSATFPTDVTQQANSLVSGLVKSTPPPLETKIPTAVDPFDTQSATNAATPEINPALEPTINYFRSNVIEADPGDTVTLEWSTGEALTVTLWHLAPTGQFGTFWDVASSGAFDYTIDAQERNYTRFALFATADADHSEMATLWIAIRCPDVWFFANEPDICPVAPAMSSGGAMQRFEGGTMIWVEEEDHIYVLFEDEGSPGWNRYVDTWDSGEPDRDPTLSPPDGLYQPARGFGLVWREQPGVRDRLGWAVDEEFGYTTLLQRTSYAKYNETYILAHDGSIWRLLPERSGWEMIDGP
ncbi:MAG: hypothetical protein WA996_08360 [Candidatus Promineifilaceae bacterium]